MILVRDEQTCPERKHSAWDRVRAAVSMSMSSRMTAADLPPSSRVQRAIRSPQMEAMRRPAAVEPVKVILSTRGSRTIRPNCPAEGLTGSSNGYV